MCTLKIKQGSEISGCARVDPDGNELCDSFFIAEDSQTQFIAFVCMLSNGCVRCELYRKAAQQALQQARVVMFVFRILSNIWETMQYDV